MNREGFMVFISTCSIFTIVLVDSMRSPIVIEGISAHSTWLAENMVALSYSAGLFLLISVLTLPFMLKAKANHRGLDLLTSIGAGILGISGILSVSYLGGMALTAIDLFLTR